MIGVVVQPEERAVAAEFFELFKTPWEFFRPDGMYEVLVCTTDPTPAASARLRLVFNAAGSANHAMLPSPKHRPDGAILEHAGRQFPIYGPASMFPTGAFALVTEASTREPALFAWRTGDTTEIRIGYDLMAEIRHLLTQGQPIRHSGRATVEIHLAVLRDLIVRAGIPLVEIPPVPDGYRLISCLSHDVDHPVFANHRGDHTLAGFLYRATIGSLISTCRGRLPVGRLWKNWLAAAKSPLVFLGLMDDFWLGFDRYLEIEAGRPSTFFVIPERDKPGRSPSGEVVGKRACRYELSELAAPLSRIKSAGGELGLHGLDAWQDAEAGRREQAQLVQALGTTERGVRMHWLYFDQHSPLALDEAGFSYDSTVGYNETAGYRAGTTQVYRPLGAKQLLELPLHVMDTALFYPYYLDLSELEARRLVTGMMDEVAGFGGVITFNWHDRSIFPERLWDQFYREMLQELQIRGTWFATAAETVAWFRQRRSVVIESAQIESRTVKVRTRLTNLDTTLPGLIIRLHKPHVLIPGEPLATGPAAGFVDEPLKDAMDLSFAL